MFSIKKKLFVSVVLALVFSLQTPVGASDVSVTGSGWGDGIGLSQYGAKALASNGFTYGEIIKHYFKGTEVDPFSLVSNESFLVSEDKPLWVGLLQDSNSAAFEIEKGTAELCFDNEGRCFHLAEEGKSYRFISVSSEECIFVRLGTGRSLSQLGSAGSCNASVRPKSPSTIIKVPFKARSYKHGILRFRPGSESGKIHTVYQVGIEDYLKGLSEISDSWPKEAIKAQVVATRSSVLYELLNQGSVTSLSSEERSYCFCNLTDSSPDQIYRGWTGEVSYPNWVSAVNATTQQVVTYLGNIALAPHSSSSGGSTESYEDVYGKDSHPYLVSVNDAFAFSDIAENPHQVWEAGYTRRILAEIYDFDSIFDIEIIDRNPSGSIKNIQISGIVEGRPKKIKVSGNDFRSSLSLRSTTFDVRVNPIFFDLAANYPLSGEVIYLFDQGITFGCENRKYCPQDYVTRGEMAAFLVRAFDLPSISGTVPYIDSFSHTFESEILVLNASGITKGCTPTHFCPEDYVTRGEMAAFLVRTLQLEKVTDSNKFIDDNGHIFEREIEILANNGITDGCDDQKFCPQDYVTRGEMAAFLTRALAL